MKERIRAIMDSKGMTQQEFSQFLEMSPASLSSIFTGRTKPTLNVVESIKNKFENINLEWLMFGEGSMFTQNEDGEGDDTTLSSDASEDEMQMDPNTSVFNQDAQVRNNMMYDNGMSNGNRNSSRNSNSTSNDAGITGMKYFNNNRRKIKEIRVFYDDQTYESFVPKE